MKKLMVIFAIILLVLILGPVSWRVARAQVSPVIFIGASSGTTLAANCPATPATPSLCLVGNGVYAWQNSTTGWFPLAPATSAGVTSFNGRTGAVVPAANDYAFSQLSGVATAAQVPAPPVTSVNGKTGVVVLGATAPAPTITVQ